MPGCTNANFARNSKSALRFSQSGRRDLNPRPPESHSAQGITKHDILSVLRGKRASVPEVPFPDDGSITSYWPGTPPYRLCATAAI